MYITDEELFNAVGPLMPYGSTEKNIESGIFDLATGDINSELVKFAITLPATDIANLLKLASVCFYISIGRMTRHLEIVQGSIQKEVWGRYQKQYTNPTPMFFFAQGSSDPFYKLLPNETFRMRGYKYVDAFITAYTAAQNDGNIGVHIGTSHDNTSRGYGWQIAIEDDNDATDDSWRQNYCNDQY